MGNLPPELHVWRRAGGNDFYCCRPQDEEPIGIGSTKERCLLSALDQLNVAEAEVYDGSQELLGIFRADGTWL